MKKIERLIPLMVLAAGLSAYHNCFQNSFVFDDEAYIVKNPHIRSLWSPQEILTHSTRPAINFSFAVNYALGGLNPWGYHLVNVGIHLLAALLLYTVVRRSMESERVGWKWAGSAPWLAGLVAMIWVVHPLQTESVAYVWQRCESLMGLFYLLTLYCVIRCDHSAWAVWWAAGAMVSCALGMASKEVMATAPVVVLLYDRVFLAGSWKEVVRRRWGLHAGLAGTWLILAVLMVRAAAKTDIYLPTADLAYEGIRPWSYLLTQAGVIVHYLRLAFWPDRLCLDYGTGWPVAKSIAGVWPQLFVVGGLLLTTAWAWWRRPALGFVGTWFFLILAPSSSFVPITDVVFEHRMYLSLAAVIVLGVIVVVALLDRLPKKLPKSRRGKLRSRGNQQIPSGLLSTSKKWQPLEWGTGAAALVLVIMFTFLTIRRNEDYRLSLTIWQDTVEKMPQNARAHNNLGTALAVEGRIDEAKARFQEALRIKPNHADAHDNLGTALVVQGRIDEAMTHYQEALRINPNHADAHNNLGTALQSLKRFDEAKAHFQEALRIKPNHADAHNNLGTALAVQGRIDEAMAHYQEALRIKPNHADAHNNLGNALQSLKRFDEAMAHFQEALRIKPNHADAHNNLGTALAVQGRIDEAMAQFQEALRIKPNHADAHNNLGNALAVQGRLQAASEHFQQALRLRPDFTSARDNLRRAEALLQQKKGSFD